MPTEVYLYGAVRTPLGKDGGALAGVRPDDLAAHVLQALIDRTPEPAACETVVSRGESPPSAAAWVRHLRWSSRTWRAEAW
jgi:acetyl-CoA acetyltransferase